MMTSTPNIPPARIAVSRIPSWLKHAVLLCVVAPALSLAQETGSIIGRIYKPSTGEYVRDAQVRVVGSDRATTSESGGIFSLTGVPVGPTTLAVSFVGYETAQASVTVVANQSVLQNFDLLREGESGVVQLDTFVVSSALEGQAKSLQNQRQSMLIGEHVSSDAFGDVVEGNVGEFLKNIPGIDLEYVEFDARGPRMRGLDPQYVGVTLDGIKLASADAFNASVGTEIAGRDGSRAFGFESMSLSSVDAVEVYKNLSADLDADAPAGTINLRTKRAFDRRGRRINYTAGLSANSEAMTLGRTPGPGDFEHHKTRPSFSLEFSDTFLKDKLGIVFNYNQSSIYNEFQQMAISGVFRGEVANDTRLVVPRFITFTDGPKISDRRTGTFRVDYKFSPKFAAGVNVTVSEYHAYWDNRQFRVYATSANNNTGRASIGGTDPMVEFSSGSGAYIQLLGDGADKFTDTISVLPSFDWKPTENLTIEGRFGWSESDNQYAGFSEGKARVTTNANLPVQFTATRSSIGSADWTFTQTGGLDWGTTTSYGAPRIGDESRSDYNEVFTGAINATWQRPQWALPTFFKFGIKTRTEGRKFHDARNWNVYTYRGPNGNATAFPAELETGDPVDLSSMGIKFNSLSGRVPAYAGRSYAAKLFNEHPEYFAHTNNTADLYYEGFIANQREIDETVDAAYVMGKTSFGKFDFQAGVRVEETTDKVKQWQQRSEAEMIAAGYAYNANTLRATSVAGLEYQFHSLPPLTKRASYDHVFTSAALKYTITENLIAQVGMHQAISRPALTRLAGVTTYDETNERVNAPNANLAPEESTNYSARIAYYLPRSGVLSAGVYQIDLDNLFVDSFYAPGTWSDLYPEIDSDLYSEYTLVTTRNSSEATRFRGFEMEYNQALSFLPSFLKGTSVNFNYTRAYVDAAKGGIAPHQVKGGISYGYKRFWFRANTIWTADTPWEFASNGATTKYRKARVQTDLTVSYRLNRWASLSISGRDITNEGMELWENRKAAGQPDELQRKNIYGSLWTFSVKGTF
jgi:iron complex outermembrane receptor protein